MFDSSDLSIRRRITLAQFVVVACFIGLVSRLWLLQIVEGGRYSSQSELNRLETVYTPPPRGQIFDRYHRLLVANRPSFNLEVKAEIIKDSAKLWKTLSPILEISAEELALRYNRQKRSHRRYESLTLVKDLSREVVAKLVQNRFNLPGVVISAVPAREYRIPMLASHILGYTREISKNQLQSHAATGYLIGDQVGQSGVERAYETFLRGKRGEKRVIVNAAGWRVGEFDQIKERIGDSLELTIDVELQTKAEELLANRVGSIVAMDPKNGDVFALASNPSFDANLFSKEMSSADLREMHAGKQLFNRALQGAFPPGSIFKPFVALRGLAEGFVSPKDRVTCRGSYYFAGRHYKCWRKGGHGSVDLRAALKSSCDVYFYSLGHRLGIDRIAATSSDFGLGALTGIGLAEEVRGIVPSQEWKKRAFKKPGDRIWYPGETLSVAIGQGALTVSPLQMARAYSVLVNGGLLVKPKLVRRISSPDGHIVVDHSEPEIERKLSYSEKDLNLVRDGLVAVVNEGGGTGGSARIPLLPPNKVPIIVGGKTGTAQVVALTRRGKKDEHEDHAWFVGYAPAKDPKIVVAALIENGGHGGSTAAPLVQEVLSQFFSRQENVSEVQAP